MTIEERFWKKVDKSNSCWLWTAYKDPLGYGRFWSGKHDYAHRFSLSLIEPLNPNKEIDHLCRNRSCVNPLHLEQVTHRINIARSPIHPSAVNAQKTHCKKGHKLPEKVPGVKRKCQICIIEHRLSYSKTHDRRQYYREYARKKRLQLKLAGA